MSERLRFQSKAEGETHSESETRKLLVEQQRARVEDAVARVQQVLDECGIVMEPQIVIQGPSMTGRVIFRPKE